MQNYDQYSYLDKLSISELVSLMQQLPHGPLRSTVAAKANAQQWLRAIAQNSSK